MKRILFVDDEPNVLQGLQRLLRSQRKEWTMAFAQSGAEALALLESTPFDVVVSDMRMAPMNGIQLLTEVKRRSPQTVRVVLSGQSDRDALLQSVGPAHQCLAKPCDTDTLKSTIARACALRELLQGESLQGLISQVSSLPSLPSLYREIVEEIQSPDASIRTVADIIARDIAMTAKVLHLVNSAFFGLGRHVASPAQAVGLLGLDTVKALVLCAQLFSSFEHVECAGFDLRRLWEHSAAVGALAREIATQQNCGPKTVDYALLAGLVHETGILVLTANLPQRYGATTTLARRRGIPLWQAEHDMLGTSHGEVGAYLLGLWGLPDPIVEAVAFHHAPRGCLSREFGALAAVHIADALESETRPATECPEAGALDQEYLESLGVIEQIGAWQKTTRALATRSTTESHIAAR
jgi:HD-like signal output (HDOD) protein/CheY-like chemotaxis protein